MPKLVWFRRDLRIADQPALFEACKLAPKDVIALFVITPASWKNHALAPVQIDFLLKNLQILSKELSELNIPLLIREVSTFEDTAALIKKLVGDLKIDALYFNRQYEWDERQRDAAVIKALETLGCATHTFDDQVIIPPEKILNLQQQPFKVFTPYKNKWLTLAETYFQRPLAKPKEQMKLTILSDIVPDHINGFTHSIADQYMPVAGEKAALKQLEKFCQQSIDHYQQARDMPALDATSHLSPYLALGIISPTKCISYVMMNQEIASFADFYIKSGVSTWISELIWREFYKMIMFHYPRVCKFQPFQASTENIRWNDDKDLFTKWCQGITGFPLVDAAMRQLNQTGWMHNRLRMVTAMFLSKILLIDWRKGERYFSEHLIDLDFSANNGGWQWSASTGTDAAPYFRIFNPITQSERFDENGNFIRHFCPELSSLNNKTIHDPFAKGSPNVHYPQKIVDYKLMRAKTLQTFKELR